MKLRSLLPFFGLVSLASAESGQEGITIQAYVDGPSELHVKTGGVYWTNHDNAKVGRLDGADEPTFINGKVWTLRWGHPKNDRGDDKTGIYGLTLPGLEFDFKLLSVGKKKEDMGIESRSAIELRRQGDEFIVRIPDREPGARWYKFVVTPKKPARK